MTKNRKPLDETLAKQFIYGVEQPSDVDETTSKETVVQPVKNKTVIQKITENIESKEPTIRFTVDMPESLHTKLSILAAKTKRKKAEIVRMLIYEALENID